MSFLVVMQHCHSATTHQAREFTEVIYEKVLFCPQWAVSSPGGPDDFARLADLNKTQRAFASRRLPSADLCKLFSNY